MAGNKPTLHHLDNSQSQRIVWLLEELSIPYNLIQHYRNPSSHPNVYRSPPSLLSASPTGQAPVLITGAADGHRIIPETSAIVTYLIRTFDTEDKFGLRNGDWIRDEVLTSLCQTVLYRQDSFMLMFDYGVIQAGNERGKELEGPALVKILEDLEKMLKEGPEGGFFMGSHPGRADIMLEFPLSFAKHRDWADFNKFPALSAWLEKVYNRDAWKNGLMKQNEEGNHGTGKHGYDLGIFPKPGRVAKR